MVTYYYILKSLTKFSQLVLSAFLNGNLLLQSEVPGDILAAGAQRVPQW